MTARLDSVAAIVVDSLEVAGLRFSAGDFVFRGNEILLIQCALLIDEHG